MGFMKILSWFIAFIIFVGGTSFFITQNIINKQAPVEEKYVMVKIGDVKDGLITNIGRYNYIKIGIVLKVREDAYPKIDGKSLNPVDVKATDTILHTLRSHKADWYSGSQDQIKEDIKKDLNQTFGEPIVLDIYINNFITQ